MTETTVATSFVKDSISSYGLFAKVLTDNGAKFDSRFFNTISVELWIMLLTARNYHRQFYGQVKRLNAAIISRLRHYFSEHQQDWDRFVAPLNYEYSTQVHGTAKGTSSV